MSPQFVDLNDDGHLDIVAGIFDGSPHVAFGDGKRWSKPVGIVDKEGKRIVLNAFWNFDTKKWDSTDRCDPEGGVPGTGHLTSTWAFDWDNDGDLDLLLGDHKAGNVYVRKNEGTNRTPAFATRNEVITADGAPIVVPGTVSTLRMIDWNGDGKQDLLVSGMGDAYGEQVGGGVWVYLGKGGDGAIALSAPMTLIAPSKKTMPNAPTRPDAGLYMDAVDYDGDGDLDLVVGGYSMWRPDNVKLSEKEEQQIWDFTDAIASYNKHKHRIVSEAAEQAGDITTPDGEAKFLELLEAKSVTNDQLDHKIAECTKRLERLQAKKKGKPKRKSFVWLYENLGAKASEGR